jgi:MoaA/NifB/PqqE/SkfB family radical SAM enzyme
MPDPTMEELDTFRGNLAGVRRVFLSGGCSCPAGSRCGAATCPRSPPCSPGSSSGCRPTLPRGLAAAPDLAGKVAFVNVGFDRPRATFTQVRGDCDKALNGLKALAAAGLPVSLSAVVLRSTLHALPYLCQIADVLDAGKVKLILPLRKGNALGLPEREFITAAEAADTFGRLTELRATHDWRPALRMTPWTEATEGHMIVVEPDGTAQAWPVYDQPDLFLRLGDLRHEPITAIWDRYPYKANHYAKYLGRAIMTAARGGL